MRLALVLATVAVGLAACGRTYTSNLAFDLTQQAYVTDRVAQATVVSTVRRAARD